MYLILYSCSHKYDHFFLIPFPLFSFVDHSPVSFLLIFQRHISISLWHFHKLLAFPGAVGYSCKCQDEVERGKLSTGRARYSQQLGAK